VSIVRGGFEVLRDLVTHHRSTSSTPDALSPNADDEDSRFGIHSSTSPHGQAVGRSTHDQGRRHGPVVAVVFDLGVSSPQLDRGERGFSYRSDAPLDMRMDPDQSLSAADVVNGYAEADLRRIITRYGEERFARSVARAIVRRRPIGTTLELAEVIKEAIPAATRRTGGHPAKRTFQAIRIEVNDELAHLEDGLDDAFALLGPGGRIAVLSYHSLEDRIVKLRFGSWATGGEHPRGLPVRETARNPRVRLVHRGAATPTAAEIEANPRARSARLRVVEKLPSEDTGS
jgi:16S rRNA (cytosine1402-N4)-methyltransferase